MSLPRMIIQLMERSKMLVTVTQTQTSSVGAGAAWYRRVSMKYDGLYIYYG
jgi:hypothetical protein